MSSRKPRITLLYFDGCPHWHLAERRLGTALAEIGESSDLIERRRITTQREAQEVGFRGSPTIQLNGRDPFEHDAGTVGMACRIHRTAAGREGAPALLDIVKALEEVQSP
jgi:hypothetical protein